MFRYLMFVLFCSILFGFVLLILLGCCLFCRNNYLTLFNICCACFNVIFRDFSKTCKPAQFNLQKRKNDEKMFFWLSFRLLLFLLLLLIIFVIDAYVVECVVLLHIDLVLTCLCLLHAIIAAI